MELSLSSAFSTGGLVGHAAYLLLIFSMLMRQMVWLRLLVIASALVGIVYAFVWLNDPVSSFWETLLVTVNLVQLFITWRQNRQAQFSAEEKAFVQSRLRGLPAGEQRRLLDQGQWVDLPAGIRLTTVSQHPEALWFLSSGAAEVKIGDQVVATCAPGSFVGEMSLVSGLPASATVETALPSRLWRIDRAVLQKLDDNKPAWLAVLEAGIARDMSGKLLLANQDKVGLIPGRA